MKPHFLCNLALVVSCLGCALPAFATARPPAPETHWVGSWASSQQIPEPANALPAADLTDATLRQVVHLTMGGSHLRVRLSNAFGTQPLRISSAHIARPVSEAEGSIDASTDTALTFNGRRAVTIPAGAEYWSDPVAFPVKALSDLAITLYLKQPPARQTSHPGSRQTSFLIHGDLVSAATLPGAKTMEHWFLISGVDVTAPREAASVVTLGDSITDGHAATTNGNNRWPDDLARRFQQDPATRNLGVLNVGTGGNRLLLYGLGPNALARFDRDVAGQTGVKYLIVLEGINDLGMLTRTHEVPAADHAALVRNIIGAYRQIVTRAHAIGIRVMGATITPDDGNGFYHPDTLNDADRRAINKWIRTPGHFDAVVDFDRLVRDPAHPNRLLPAFDSGDHLHPSPAGYRAMANAIPLAFFTSTSSQHR